jgi:hypothetical protein
VLVLIACDRSAQTGATASSTTSAESVLVRPSLSDEPLPKEYEIMAPDSAEGFWYVDTPNRPSKDEFITGWHVRHPSGKMVIWLDTAIKATGGRVHTDSIVVSGIHHLEYLARFCSLNGKNNGRVFGLVEEADTLARPRLAWRFNTESFRIDQVPVDSVSCTMRKFFDEVD